MSPVNTSIHDQNRENQSPPFSKLVGHTDTATNNNNNPAVALRSTHPASINSHSMTTREKAGVYKPKIFLAYSEPSSVKESLADSNWKHAMIEEVQAL